MPYGFGVIFLYNLTDIIIVKYRNPEAEERCLESVRKFTDLTKHKLTVFDNAPENINLGKLWNQLIEASDEEVICLLNSDCVVEEGWTRLEDGLELPEVGAVGPVTDNCGTAQKGMSKGEPMTINDLSGFCYVFRKSVWKEVGGFPEDMPFYGQESIFNRKLQDRGHKLMVDRRVFVSHEKGGSFKKAQERGEAVNDEAEWGAFHYYNFLDRLRILRSIVPKDFRCLVIGGGKNNPFPLHRGMEQAVKEFFGANGLVIRAEQCFEEFIDLFKPDFILNTQTKYDEELDKVLKKAKRQGIKTALYYNDFRCPSHDRYKAPPVLCQDLSDRYDAMFFCSEVHRECWQESAKVPVYYLPQGSIQHPKPIKGTKYDVLHVGSLDNGIYHSGRLGIIAFLKKQKNVVSLNSPNGTEIERQKRINIQNNSYGDYHASDYSLAISPDFTKYTSDRLYTIIGAGGCALSFKPDRMNEMFTHGEHVLWFRDIPDIEKIFKTVSVEDRERIKSNAFKHGQKHHLYKNRLLNILQNIYTEDRSFHGDLNNLYKIGK